LVVVFVGGGLVVGGGFFVGLVGGGLVVGGGFFVVV
jgi:hypothetical protein